MDGRGLSSKKNTATATKDTKVNKTEEESKTKFKVDANPSVKINSDMCLKLLNTSIVNPIVIQVIVTYRLFFRNWKIWMASSIKI